MQSFTGVELLRVLISNNIGPILLIAFTNHALDNIITHVLDKGLTEKVVRLGSRSNDENLAKYTLEQIMRTKKSQAERSAGKQYAMMKDAQQKMSTLMFRIGSTIPAEEDLRPYLRRYCRQQHDSLYKPPSWIQLLLNDSEDWQTVLKRGSRTRTEVEIWRTGEDIAFITPPPDSTQGPNQSQNPAKKATRRYDLLPKEADEDSTTEDEDEDEEPDPPSWPDRMADFFAQFNISGIPEIPSSNRPLDQLLNNPDVWSMSIKERGDLYSHWADQVREHVRDPQKAEFNRLKHRHAEARSAWSDIMDQVCFSVILWASAGDMLIDSRQDKKSYRKRI